MINSIGNAQTAFYAGLEGLQNGERSIESAAQKIASPDSSSSSSSDLIDLKQGELQAQASAKVLSTSDNMLGTLIDTLA